MGLGLVKLTLHIRLKNFVSLPLMKNFKNLILTNNCILLCAIKYVLASGSNIPIAESRPGVSTKDFIDSIESEMKKILNSHREESEAISAELNNLLSLYQVKLKKIRDNEASHAESKEAHSGCYIILKKDTKQHLQKIVESRDRIRNKTRERLGVLKKKLLPYPSLNEKLQIYLSPNEDTHALDAMINVVRILTSEQ